jgi:hypothetical protein
MLNLSFRDGVKPAAIVKQLYKSRHEACHDVHISS